MKVCIVLDPNLGTGLKNLNLSLPIWVVQSPTNDPVVAELWKSKVGNLTSFRPQDFGQMIDTVDQHHPGWLELYVFGMFPPDTAAILAEYGDGQITPSGHGFQFIRRKS